MSATSPADRPILQVIIASTRTGRVGPAIARWFEGFAREHGKFEVVLVDLAELNLPLLDEPAHPRLRQYQHQHTKDWSAKVQAADAFALVTPEYNYSPSPALLNAMDYLYVEWNYKPVGFVSYGGISGGIRAVQMMKMTVTTMKMMPMVEAVTIPFFNQHISDAGTFDAKDTHEQSGREMLDELSKWAVALKTMRQ